MSNRSRRSSEDRAEARRRARLAARQPDSDVEMEDDEGSSRAATASGGAGGSLLTRLFPPAPPLPGKPDPLASFTYTGAFRGQVAGLYLLAVNPVPWLGLGAAWGVGRILTAPSILGLVASLVSFGALILAGWMGWQRPWLFGLAASIVGMLIYAGIVAGLLGGTAQANGLSGPAVFVNALLSETIAFQPLFGVVAGWYGGYLRRRMAVTSAAAASARGGRSRRR